ncbi:MAG: protein kinase [Alphaproteobacteria bacterium]|nr:protein kinase [Alphaproteobacteria bacterium]MCB9695575.1 protein kinase [Alphaproteobacteria bacterium]
MKLGSFRLTEVLGRGGVGEVWRGEHETSGDAVAIKVLLPENAGRWRSLLRREVEAVARLDHPGVIWIHDHGEDPERGPWIAFELASGGSLQDRLPVAGWQPLRALLSEILGALAHAHARGVLHRDLKPANVLLCTLEDPRPGPKLCDFSLARVGGSRGVAGGTPDYLAPEQRAQRWRDEGPWTDLYALGGLAWAGVCGAPPTVTPWRPRFAVPDGFGRWVEHLLAEDPRDRIRSAAAALAALRALDDPGPGSLLPARDRTFDVLDAPPRPHPRRSPASLGLFGLRPIPLVGRTTEQQVLTGMVAGVVAGTGPRVLRVWGEAGIGKSALLGWLGATTLESGVAEVLSISAVPDLVSGLRRALTARYGGLGPTPTECRARIVEVNGRTADRLHAFVEGGEDDPSELLQDWAAALGRPALVLIDDLARGGEIDRWLPAAWEHAPPNLAVVLGARHPARNGASEELALTRLSAPAAIPRALGVADRTLAQEIGVRSAGLPSLAVAVVRQLVRDGALQQGPRGWERRAGARAMLPEDVAREIHQRLPIAEADRAALEVLAVCGPIATREVWAEACERLGADASEEVAEGLRRSGTVVGTEIPRLADDLLNDMLVEELKSSGRVARIAGVVADVVTARLPAEPDRDDHLGELSFLAGRPEVAAPLLLRASSRRRNLNREERAHQLLDLAFEALDAAPPSPANEALRSRALLWRAGLLTNDGRVDDALASIEALQPVGEEAVRRHRLLLAELLLRVGRLASALPFALASIEPASSDHERDHARQVAAQVLSDGGRYREAVTVLEGVHRDVASELRARALMAMGALDAAERALDEAPLSDRDMAEHLRLARLELEWRRGRSVWDELAVLWAGRRCATHPQFRPFVAGLRALVAARERPEALPTVEAELREALALAGTRSTPLAALIAEAARDAEPSVAERLRDLAALQEPLELLDA